MAMKETGEIIWLVNRSPWLYVTVMVAVFPLGLLLGILIFGLAPCWAYLPGLLVAAVVIIPGLARGFVFRVGIGREKIIFVKVHRRIAIEKSNIISYDVSPPLDLSERSKPWHKVVDRSLTLELSGGEKTVFKAIEGHIVSKLSEDFEKCGVQLNTELESSPNV